ncbi:tyrosinase precursor [Fusarium heterosporum]|uniref:tyrosinase n=1 Tax=Fusarium heterosporum TaxID=42747 RepID=A0A8H5SVS3_FUSHE|nr:tyrosinase precursor [Fusarium heterosporum]
MAAFTGKTFPITGIPSNAEIKTKTIPYAPGLPARYNIAKFFPSDDPFIQKQWTLMVMAMNRFKAIGVEERLSYFQVAGIHAYPLQPWDGAKPPPQDPKDPNKLPPGANPYGGYRQHNTITFPTWHRPYMMLFEQLVWKHMNEIIEEWKLDTAQETEWKKAADTWRLPYWDWARKQQYNQEYALPEVLLFERVTTYPPDKPKGELDVPNPFWGFENPEKKDGKPRAFGDMPEGKTEWNIGDDKGAGFPWSKCSGVSRYGIFTEGDSYKGLEGVNNYTEANFIFNNFDKNWYNPNDPKKQPDFTPPGTLADAVNRLFSSQYTDTWDTFASTKYWAESAQEVSTGYLSLEYIHNNIHNLTGGSNLKAPGKIGGYGLGHMSDVPVAAFDPVFWLHHCNIDRLLAMWQALNWKSWFDQPRFIKGKVPDKSQYEDLLPFHAIETEDPSTGYWNSHGVRDWTKLNYQYDDLIPQPDAILPDNTLNEDRYKVDLAAHIQKIYPSAQKYYEAIYANSDIANKDFFGPTNTEKTTWNDYLINVVYDRYALNGKSYAIEFWLGGKDNDPESTFKDQENLIGQVYSFGGMEPSAEGCANCGDQKKNKVLSRAQVLLTIPVMSQALDNRYSHITSTRTDPVEGYLQKHLHWKFVEIGGQERPADQFPDTQVSVLRGTGKAQEPDEETQKSLPPVYANYEILYRPTEQKACGLVREDEILGEDQDLHFRTF